MEELIAKYGLKICILTNIKNFDNYIHQLL